MAIELIRKRTGNSKQPEFLTALKFVMAVSIGVTFFVFMLLLAPTDAKGFIGAYQDNHYASLCEHFIAPVSSLIYYFVFDTGVSIRKEG